MKHLIIVIPAHNEEEIIKQNVMQTINFLKNTCLNVTWKVIVAENGSEDRTLKILKNMPTSKHFDYISLQVSSRSKAIKQAWLNVDADYYMFMDADLSTNIKHIPELINALQRGGDIAIGSRRLKKSRVKRTIFRSVLSFGFNTLMRLIFNLGIHDFQCGFKLINKKIRNEIIPKMKYGDQGFLDTEMMAVAHNKGYVIKEIPVNWADIRLSKFKISRTIYMVLLNSLRIKRDILLGKYE